MSNQDINVLAPINQLGYGIVGLNVVKSLVKSGHRVALSIIGQIDASEEDYGLLSECVNNFKLPNFSAPCIRIWHQHDMSQFVGRGSKIGFPIFELDSFTDQEKHHLKSLDQIFVCSNWAKKIVADNINHDSVSVVPLGVDLDVFTETFSERSETIFYNCGKWEIRKGHDAIIEAFNKAFQPSDDVELWMMCDNPFLSKDDQEKWHDLYKRSRLGDKIRLIPRQQTQKDVYNIMRQTDCGVFPSRAEGWNLELLEMMSCGKHVIATDYSAHTEFCNNENCRLIKIEDLEAAYDGKWFFNQGQWGSLGDKQVDQVVKNFQEVHKLKQTGSLGANTSWVETAKRFSWSNTAKEIINAIPQRR